MEHETKASSCEKHIGCLNCNYWRNEKPAVFTQDPVFHFMTKNLMENKYRTPALARLRKQLSLA